MLKVRGMGQEELPHVRGQGQKPGGHHARGQGWWREEKPHIQGAVAARTQEGLEELLHIQGQEG